MKVKYRGHKIKTKKEKSVKEYKMIFWTITRDDGYPCDTGFEDGNLKTDDVIVELKKRIDSELASDDPWGEIGKPAWK